MREQGVWCKIIEAITAPLGFFVLALLIVESFLATVLVCGNLDSPDKMIDIWLGVGLFILVTVAVFILVWFKPKHLTFDKDSYLEEAKNNYLTIKEKSSIDDKSTDIKTTSDRKFFDMFIQLQFKAMCVLYLFEKTYQRSKVIPLSAFNKLNLDSGAYATGVLNGLETSKLLEFKIHKEEIVIQKCDEVVERNIGKAFDIVLKVLMQNQVKNQSTLDYLKNTMQSIDEWVNSN